MYVLHTCDMTVFNLLAGIKLMAPINHFVIMGLHFFCLRPLLLMFYYQYINANNR